MIYLKNEEIKNFQRPSVPRRKSNMSQKSMEKPSKKLLRMFMQTEEEIDDFNIDYIEILKKELSKNNLIENESKKEGLKKRGAINKNLILTSGIKLHVYEYTSQKEKIEHKDPKRDNSNTKNTNLIFTSLKQLPNFVRYQKLNFISDEAVKEAIPHLKYKYLKKNDIIYDESNEGQRFYGLISGKILIRNIPKKLTMSMLKKKTQMLNANVRFLDIFLGNPNFEKIINKNEELQGDDKDVNEKEIISKFCKVIKSKFGNSWIHKLNLTEYEEKAENGKILNKPGECFGDWEILNTKFSSTKKNTTAICLEDSHIFYLDKKEFIDYFSKGLLRGDHERKEFIKLNIHPLAESNKFEIYYKKISIVIVEKDEIIYSEYSTGEYFYLIYQGGCRIQKYSENKEFSSNKKSNNDNKLIDVLRVEKGCIFGLESVFESDNLYKFTLKATQNFTILFKIKYSDVNLNNSNPLIEEFLLEYYKRQNEMLLNTYNNYKSLLGNIKPVYNKIKLNFDTFKYDSKKCEEIIVNEKQLQQQNQKRENDFKIGKMQFNRNKLLSKSTEEGILSKSKQPTKIRLHKKNLTNMNLYRVVGNIQEDNEGLKTKIENQETNEKHFYVPEKQNKMFSRYNLKINSLKGLFTTETARKLNLEKFNKGSSQEPLKIKETIQKSAANWKKIKTRNHSFYKSGNFNLPLLSMNN